MEFKWRVEQPSGVTPFGARFAVANKLACGKELRLVEFKRNEQPIGVASATWFLQNRRKMQGVQGVMVDFVESIAIKIFRKLASTELRCGEYCLDGKDSSNPSFGVDWRRY